ncbi:MAG: nuclear transport factor 2 family protein [Acidimicrobiales bacterium]
MPDLPPPGDLEAIRILKYRYLRLLDTKQFEALGELLTDDVTTAYQSGVLRHRGRSEVVGFLDQSLGAGLVTMHTCHHPEITLTSSDTATGVWYLEDLVIVPGQDYELHGTAVYRDEYRRESGGWRISHTGYDRIFERARRPSTGEQLSFRSRFDPPQ